MRFICLWYLSGVCFSYVRTRTPPTPVSRLFPDRYWEAELWDNLFDKLLNVDIHSSDAADDTASLLAHLASHLRSYVYHSPKRSMELQELLKKQDRIIASS